MAAQMRMNQPSYWWLLDDHTTSRRSPWLQSTLAELNEKTKAMLKLIEQDADSFAQRAEMYYKRRPELIRMVEDFYRTHRSLAERYDQVQVKPDSGIRTLISGGSPFASAKFQAHKFMSFTDPTYDNNDSFSERSDVEEESAESEVDDPEEEVDTEFDNKKEEVNEEVKRLSEENERLREENMAYKDQIKLKDAMSDEVMVLRKEIERLREENRAQKDQLKKKDFMADEVKMLREVMGRVREENRAQKDQLRQKDEEKIEVIKHLSVAIDMIKQENLKMRDFIAKDCTKKLKNPFEFNKFMGTLSGKLFNGYPWNKPSVVAL